MPNHILICLSYKLCTPDNNRNHVVSLLLSVNCLLLFSAKQRFLIIVEKKKPQKIYGIDDSHGEYMFLNNSIFLKIRLCITHPRIQMEFFLLYRMQPAGLSYFTRLVI